MRKLAIGILVTVAACTAGNPAEGPSSNREGTPSSATGEPLPMRSLLQEYNTGLRDSVRQVITDGESLALVWAQAHEGRGEVPAVPSVDFTTEMVIVAALGTRNSGGYPITIDSVVASGTALHVYVRKTSPGPTCGTTGALTEPASIVAVPRSTASVVFDEIDQRSDCG